MSCSEAPDLTRCNVLEIFIGLFEYERARDCPSTWPDEVVRRARRELQQWRKRNPESVVMCSQMHATIGQCGITIWHGGKQ
jgi:hypothetical protein